MLKIDRGRISDPENISAVEIADASGRLGNLVVQFSRPSAYPAQTLIELNKACQIAGAKLQVRFYGHYDGSFDAMSLRHLPDVQNLALDSLTSIVNEDEVGKLRALSHLHFAVFEFNRPDFLNSLQLAQLEGLGVGENRQRNMDLSLLAECRALQTLFVHGHTKSLAAIGTLPQLQNLTFSGLPASAPLSFISGIPQLRRLKLLLGSRTNLSEASSDTLEELQIIRVRGLTTLDDLRRFPALTSLSIEDQAQLSAVDFNGVHLQRLKIQNCSTMRDLVGLDQQDHLVEFFAYKLAVDWDHLRDRSWPKGSSVVLGTTSRRWNEDARQRLGARGLTDQRSRWD